jgi:hypothetical protein
MTTPALYGLPPDARSAPRSAGQRLAADAASAAVAATLIAELPPGHDTTTRTEPQRRAA